ncbi:MAG: histidinol dehydrogenase [Myxococcales bacterium]|nr:histidinol dehydrogenase [Myxococcales bacterium]
MDKITLRRLSPDEVRALSRRPVDDETLAQAGAILADVRRDGAAAVRRHAERLGDIEAGADLLLDRAALEAALERVGASQRALLERCAARVRSFAEAQRAALVDIERPIPGGVAGHTVRAVTRAGCYAPGGRFPLPSTVLMTAVTARAAGVAEVIVASPRPSDATLAAAAVAGADALLCVGGAQAIGALAYGLDDTLARCDVIVGPGNRWVTAAKALCVGEVGIDMLAGPTELLVVADAHADAALVAADLLAQAEHDVDAQPMLVSTDAALVARVEAELAAQLATLATAETARVSLARNSFCVVVRDIAEAATIADLLGPEHLSLALHDAADAAARFRCYGALFIGEGSAEVIGDYCAGPNHSLPTGGSARFTGGLSVLHFVRVQSYLRVDDRHAAAELYADAEALAALEGLAGHGAAARRRR